LLLHKKTYPYPLQIHLILYSRHPKNKFLNYLKMLKSHFFIALTNKLEEIKYFFDAKFQKKQIKTNLYKGESHPL
jgi:hypothetical protein